MPQSMNKRVCLDRRIAAPAHKDSFRGTIFDLSVETRKRALRMNEGQDLQLQLKTKYIERNKREQYIKETKRIQEIDSSVKQLNIYKKVLKNFTYDNLEIVKKKHRKISESARKRINAETKILHSGFSFSLLKPQMDVISKELDPRTIRQNKLRKQYIVSKARSDIELLREGTFSALIKDYKDKSIKTETYSNENDCEIQCETQKSMFKLPQIKIKHKKE